MIMKKNEEPAVFKLPGFGDARFCVPTMSNVNLKKKFVVMYKGFRDKTFFLYVLIAFLHVIIVGTIYEITPIPIWPANAIIGIATTIYVACATLQFDRKLQKARKELEIERQGDGIDGQGDWGKGRRGERKENKSGGKNKNT